jgi:putative flippase GtrA
MTNGTPINQPTATPTTKVAAGASWGVITILVAYLLKVAWGVELPAEVSSALTVVISFIAAYFTRERR